MSEQTKLLITHNEQRDDWAVWITVPDHDPERDAFGFIFGGGETRDAAVASAVAALEEAVKLLQLPSGAVEERVSR